MKYFKRLSNNTILEHNNLSICFDNKNEIEIDTNYGLVFMNLPEAIEMFQEAVDWLKSKEK